MIALSEYVGASLVGLNSAACAPSLNSEILRSTPLGGVAIDDVAAGKEVERTKACRAAQETTATGFGHQLAPHP